MIFKSLVGAVPYMIVLFVGICAFADAFQSLDQIIYKKTANNEAPDVISPPFDKSNEIHTFWDWKDVYIGEYMTVWRNQALTALGAFDAA